MNDFKTLKAWVHWKRKDAEAQESGYDLDLVKDIEDLISQVGTWKAKYEKSLSQKVELIISINKEDVNLNRTFSVFFDPDPAKEVFNVGQTFYIVSVNRETGQVTFNTAGFKK